MANIHSKCMNLPPALSLTSLERLYAMSTPEVKRPDTPLLATFPREGVAFITAVQDLEEYHKNDSFTTPFSPTFYDNIFNNTLPVLPYDPPTPDRSHSHNSPKRTRDEEDEGYTSDESRNSKPKRHQTSSPLFSATSGAMKTFEIGASGIGSEGDGVVMDNVGGATNDAALPKCGVEAVEKSMKSNDGAEGVAAVIKTGKGLEKIEIAGEKVDERVAGEKNGFRWIGSLFHKVLPIRQRTKVVQKQ